MSIGDPCAFGRGFILNSQNILTWKSLSELASPWFLFSNIQFGPSIAPFLRLTLYTITPDYYILKPSENSIVSKIIPNKLLFSGHLYQKHLVLGTQPQRLDQALTFSGRHGKKLLVAFLTISELPISESERQWPYVPSHWHHHLGSTPAIREGGRAGERVRGSKGKTPRELFLWGTEMVKMYLEDSKSLPFLQQNLLVFGVSSCWSERYWIKTVLDFMSRKLWVVLLRK